MDSVFIQEQIDFYTSQVAYLRESILEVSQNPNNSYSLDTGQTKESVKKMSLSELNAALKDATEMLEFWQNQLNGNNGLVLRPAW